MNYYQDLISKKEEYKYIYDTSITYFVPIDSQIKLNLYLKKLIIQ